MTSQDLTSTTMWKKMQSRVQTWQNSGKKEGLIEGREIFAARCWWNDNGLYRKNHELYDPALEEYIHASTDFAAQALPAAADGKSWSALLRGRAYCDNCGTRYSLENLSICTGCLDYVCCGHRPRGRAFSGEPSCKQQHAKCDGTVVG